MKLYIHSGDTLRRVSYARQPGFYRNPIGNNLIFRSLSFQPGETSNVEVDCLEPKGAPFFLSNGRNEIGLDSESIQSKLR